MGSRTDRSQSRRGRSLGIFVAIFVVLALTAIGCSGGSSKKVLTNSGSSKISSDSGSSKTSSGKSPKTSTSSDSSSFSDSSNLSGMFSGDSSFGTGGGDLSQNPTFRSSFLKSCEAGLSASTCNCILGKLHGSNVSALQQQAATAARQCASGG